jgi:hypothetical protein
MEADGVMRCAGGWIFSRCLVAVLSGWAAVPALAVDDFERQPIEYSKATPDNRVSQRKVSTGRRSGERLEIRQGLDERARVVLSGGGFLADGDTVRVVAAAPAAPAVAFKTPASR